MIIVVFNNLGTDNKLNFKDGTDYILFKIRLFLRIMCFVYVMYDY